MSNKYYVVTTVSQYRMRYVIPVEDLRDEEGNVSKEWAMDSVTMEEVEEFSQEYLGEVIIDATEEDEEALLARFDEENDYLGTWSREQKLNHIRSWRYEG